MALIEQNKNGYESIYLNDIEMYWLSDISCPHEIIDYDHIGRSLRRQEHPRQILVDEAAQYVFASYNLSERNVQDIYAVLGRFRYDTPQHLLHHISKKPFIVDMARQNQPVLKVPDFHYISVDDEQYIEGNCVVLANHLSEELYAQGVIEEIAKRVRKNGVEVMLTVNNGQCHDLFSQEDMNHWYCALHFIKGHDIDTLIIDPSFRRITTESRYRTFENQTFLVYAAMLKDDVYMSMSTAQDPNLPSTNMALGSSSDYHFAYGLSFHTDGRGVLPILSVVWDNPRKNNLDHIGIYIDQCTGLPVCDHSITSQFTLKNRIQLVQCLSQMNSFTYVYGCIE